MPSFITIEQITIRGGPDAYKFGDYYNSISQGKLEHDGWMYLYGTIGMNETIQTPVTRDALRRLIQLGKEWGWKGLRWDHMHKDGKHHTMLYSLETNKFIKDKQYAIVI